MTKEKHIAERMKLTEVILTENDLSELLPYWQSVLRLQDWIIRIDIVGASILEGRDAMVSYHLDNKQASIKILKPDDYSEDCWFPQDMEWSLVHELLHLHISTINPENENGQGEEQAIESIAYGLLKLKRS